jgi:hypothetical protein
VQTRNPDHQSAQELAQLPNVTFHVGHVESEELLREAIHGMDAVYLLANSFAIGEKAELHWSIRAFELARELGVKLFQFSSLDYLPNKAGYDPKFRCAHYDAKGRVSGTSLLFWSVPMQPNQQRLAYTQLLSDTDLSVYSSQSGSRGSHCCP